MPKVRSKVSNVLNVESVNLGKTQLHLAVKDANVSHVNQLLHMRADVNVRDAFKRTPLHDVADKRLTNLDLKIADILLNFGADVNARDAFGRTPLHEVAKKIGYKTNQRLAEILLIRGADVNAVDVYNRTPIFSAMNQANPRILRLFLSFEANVRVVDDQGCNLLFPAVAFNRNVEVVQLLLNLGLDVNHFNNIGSMPLHWACETMAEYGNVDIIKCLLRNGANMNATNMKIIQKTHNKKDFMAKDESTPLIAAMVGYSDDKKEKFRFLLEYTKINDDVRVLTFNYKSYQESLWKMVLEYLAKLQTLDIPVHRDLLEIISDQLNYKHFKGYYSRCTDELLKAKSTRLHGRITFYNLLVDSRKKIQFYLGNNALIKELKKGNCLKKFPIYGSLIEENVIKEIRRRDLIDKSAVELSNCLPILNYFIIKDVINCVMSKKDLSKFCEQS